MTLRTRKPVPQELTTFKKSREEYNLPICGDILRRILALDPNIMIDEKLQDIFAEIKHAQQICGEIQSNDDMPGRQDLFPYQRVAMHWLAASRRGILADGQGMGKTVMTVAAAQMLNPRRTIVVVPLIKISDWDHHIQKWIPNAKTLRFHGTAAQRKEILAKWLKQDGYLITNFKTMQIHEAELIKASGSQDLMIIDEAHKLRNRKTGIYSTAKKISRKIGGVFLITASPTVNAAEDIWALLSILDPVRFGSFWGFAYRFLNVEDDGFGLKINGVKSTEREALGRIIQPYILRRSEKLELTEMKFRREEYEMRGTQAKMYKSMLEDMECTYDKKEFRVWDKLAQITRLRQLALDPGLLYDNYKGPSKLNMLVNLVQERGGQVVIFATYAKLVNLATKVLKDAGITAVSIFGGLSPSQRSEALASFRSGEARVILLTHKTGGEGLDLVEADRAIFLELAWHPAGCEHAAKRIHRFGQLSDNVEVIFLHTIDSIEDQIYDIVMSKKKVTIKELIKGLPR
jgi:SNF2 family DNA or RNA helicase